MPRTAPRPSAQPAAAPSAATARSSFRSDLLAALAVLALTAAAFAPALRAAFVFWDDDFNFLYNPHYRGLGMEQLRWMFGRQSLAYGHYMPLTWLTYGLDFRLWGMDGRGYHLTNLLIHGASAAAFYLVARLLLARAWREPAGSARVRWGAALGAALFAIHPLRVEAVAWITQRRETLAGCLYLYSLWAYLKACEAEAPAGRRRWHAGALALFLLSLLSKETAITLPFLWIILDVYPLRRLEADPRTWTRPASRAVWMEKAPVFALFALGLLVRCGTLGWEPVRAHEPGFWLGCLAWASCLPAFFLWKTLFPHDLTGYYERIIPFPTPGSYAAAAALLTIVLTVAFWRWRRRFPALLAAWVFYLVALAPGAVGLLNDHFVAERFSYVACLGWELLAGAALAAWCLGEGAPARRAGARIGAAAVLLGLCAQTFAQTRLWRDSETLWAPAIAKYPNFATPYNNVGADLQYRQQWEASIPWFRKAIAADPRHFRAHVNLGWSFQQLGRLPEAIAEYQQAVSINPNSELARQDLQAALTLARP